MYDPATGKGSQLNGHVPGGIIPHKLAVARKLMDSNNDHMLSPLQREMRKVPLQTEGPKKPDLRIV